VAYYRGDYLPGYYRGSIFGSIGKVLGGAALGFVTGGPLGAIRGAIGGTASAVKSGTQQATLAAGGNYSAMTPALRQQHAAAIATHSAPIGSSIAATPHGSVTKMMGPPVGVMGPGGGGVGRVPRPSGHGFYSARHLRALQMGLTRAKPRMNWANGRALSRAERRISSFLRHARKYYHMVHPRHGGTLHARFGRRKRK
jgi:hypothetical protein